jgi:type II secretion system protein I
MNSNPSKPHPGIEGGFTLLEVMVSLAIISTALVLCYRVMAGALAAEDRSERWTAAACLGEELMRDATGGSFPDVDETEGDFPEPWNEYSWKKTVKESLYPDVREIEVTVSWKQDGNPESVTLWGAAVK